MIFCSILQYTVHWNKPPLAYLGLCASIQQEAFMEPSKQRLEKEFLITHKEPPLASRIY